MIALTPYEAGRLAGVIFIPLALVVTALVLRRKGVRNWWIPLAVAPLAALPYAIRLTAEADDPRPTPSAVRALPVTSVFLGVEGYELTNLDYETYAAIQLQFTRAGGGQGIVRQVEVRSVDAAAGDEVARLIVIETDPGRAGAPNFVGNFVAGFADQANAKPDQRDVAGIETYWIQPGTGELAGYTFVIWREENLIILVSAPDAGEAEAVMRAISGRTRST